MKYSQSFPSGSFHKPLILMHQRADRMETTINRTLTKLITWITVLFNSVQLWAMSCRATQDGRVMVESTDKMQSTGEGNGKPLQYSCFENPMSSMKYPNQIDYILCSQRGRSSIQSTKTRPGATRSVAQIMNSLLPNSDLNWRKKGKPLDHSGMT